MKTNIQLQKLIDDLKKQSYTENVKIWKRIARDLEKPTQNQRIVNVNKLEKYMNDDEIMIVPGKVLGGGDLNAATINFLFKSPPPSTFPGTIIISSSFMYFSNLFTFTIL